MVAAIVRASHERFDGTGYPDKLAGEEIPFGARIVAACDAYNSMTSVRPYGTALSRDEALAELRRCAGTQFDPVVVAAIFEVLERRDERSLVARTNGAESAFATAEA
jgi:HD-GYP domain-containing protein (c-di-GMP phosphodiesterase class II)